MPRSASADVFTAIAEAHRRRILDALLAGERPVGEIVGAVGLAQPQVSKHLRVLSDAGLVRCRADGRRRLYRINHRRLRVAQGWLEKFERAWRDRLDRMDDYLQDLQRKDTHR